MMYGHEKSDRCVVPRKSLNKVEQSAAERMEGRHLGEGNAEWEHTPRTLRRICVPSAPTRWRRGTGWVATTPNPTTLSPKPRARCGNSARRDLRGGCAVMRIPTATRMRATDPANRQFPYILPRRGAEKGMREFQNRHHQPARPSTAGSQVIRISRPGAT